MQKGYDDIYMKYANTVKRFLMCMTSDFDLSEELTQETFYQAYKSIHRYNGTCKMSVWLCQIAKHLYFDYLKKIKHMKLISIEDMQNSEQMISSPNNPEELYVFHEDVNSLLNVIQNTKEPYRQIFLLRLYEELSYKEIGQIFEKSENWARVAYYRAKNMIKERVVIDEDNL